MGYRLACVALAAGLLASACSDGEARAAPPRAVEPAKTESVPARTAPAPVQHAVSEAEAKAERERVLASNEVEQWEQLVAKYPGTVEATAAASRIEARSSICAAYAAHLPFNFSEYLLFEETFINIVTMRLGSWEPSQGGLPLMGIAGDALPLLEPKQQALEETCHAIAGHQALPGEDPVRVSMLDDCKKLKARFKRMHDALVPSSVNDNFVANMTETWPRMAKETAALTKAMITSADKRQAECKKLGAPPWNNAKDPG